jgi:plastocyanin
MKDLKEGPTDTTDESTDWWGSVERRPLLKILGLGGALSLGSAGVSARDASDESEDIDPLYGLSAPDAENIGADVTPDHEVELHVDGPVSGVHGPLFHFEPTGLHVDPDDVVQFTFQTPDHTVTAYHPGQGFQRRVPENVGPFSSPVINAGGAWLYRFQEEGVYDLYCGPHHILGMNMRIVVGDLAAEDVPDYVDTFEGSEEPPLLAPFSKEFLETELEEFAPAGSNRNSEWPWLTPVEVLSADMLAPETIQAEESVPFDAVVDEILRFKIAEEGHYAWFPLGPDSWARSAGPYDIQEGISRWLGQPTDTGGVRLLAENIGTEPPNRNTGFDLRLGSLADIKTITLESRTVQTRSGSTAELFVGLFLDKNDNGEFFAWGEQVDGVESALPGIAGDEEGIIFIDTDGESTIDDSTTFELLDAETEITLGELQAGEVEGISGETAAALYVGVVGGNDGIEEVVIEQVDIERD